MDELEILERHRPVRLRPTPAERASAKQSLMANVGEPPIDEAPIALDARRRPRKRRYLVAAAAVIAALALVGTLAFDGGDSGPLATRPAAADELHRLADLAAGEPLPAVPYRQVSRVETTDFTVAGADGEPVVYDSVSYTLGDGNYITDLSGCRADVTDDYRLYACISMPAIHEWAAWLPLDGSRAEIRAAVDAKVAELVANTELSESAATLDIVGQALLIAQMSPSVRAELLHMLADGGEVRSTPNVTTALGESGTRFTVDTPYGAFELIIDPDDGFLLETSNRMSSYPPVSSTRISLARPEAATELPSHIAMARDALVANAAQIEADMGGLSGDIRRAPGPPWCVTGIGTLPGTQSPELQDVMTTHCWPSGS